MKVVLDTNVLFAALWLKTGTCARLLRVVTTTQHLFLSDYILAELSRHLLAKQRLPKELVHEIDRELRSIATLVIPAAVDASICADSDDLPILGTAVAAGADFLITGDKELLAIGEIGPTRIWAPSQFLIVD